MRQIKKILTTNVLGKDKVLSLEGHGEPSRQWSSARFTISGRWRAFEQQWFCFRISDKQITGALSYTFVTHQQTPRKVIFVTIDISTLMNGHFFFFFMNKNLSDGINST